MVKCLLWQLTRLEEHISDVNSGSDEPWLLNKFR